MNDRRREVGKAWFRVDQHNQRYLSLTIGGEKFLAFPNPVPTKRNDCDFVIYDLLYRRGAPSTARPGRPSWQIDEVDHD